MWGKEGFSSFCLPWLTETKRVSFLLFVLCLCEGPGRGCERGLGWGAVRIFPGWLREQGEAGDGKSAGHIPAGELLQEEAGDIGAALIRVGDG